MGYEFIFPLILKKFFCLAFLFSSKKQQQRQQKTLMTEQQLNKHILKIHILAIEN